GAGEPLLQQRGGGADDGERQTDRDEQDGEQAHDGVVAALGDQVLVDGDGKENGEKNDRKKKEGNVQNGLLARPEPGNSAVGVGVAGQQQRLEKDHAGVPDRRRAAKQRRDHLADHRLDQEQQQSAAEERQRKDGEHQYGEGPQRYTSVVGPSSEAFQRGGRR